MTEPEPDSPSDFPSGHAPPEGQKGKILQSSFALANVLLLLGIGLLGLALLYFEGYFDVVRWWFALYIAIVTLAGLWFAAFETSHRRLLALVLVAGVAGYLTQIVGSDVERNWLYAETSYYFVPSMFAFAATAAYGLTSAVIGPAVRRHLRFVPRWPNLLIVAALFTTLIVGANQYEPHHSVYFWVYYVALGLFAAWVALMMDVATMITLVGVAIAIGALSETMGASSCAWEFRGTPWLPPAYLVFGSWPLEIVFHYGMSGLLANEKLLARPKLFRENVLFDPKPEHPMFTGTTAHRVVSIKDADKKQALDRAIEEGGLYEVIERRLEETKKAKEDLAIIIKPNLMFMYSEIDRSTFTDVELVEHLVERIWEKGYRNIKVVEAQSAYGNFFFDRDVAHVAKVAGYRPNDHYSIVDLTLEKVPHTFTGPLGEHVVGPTWRDADVRISFAKNKTHTWAWYTLTIKNIYGALAMQDKIYEYHYKRELYYPTIDMLVSFPVHFGIIDASLSADGPFGIFADKKPNKTDTIIAGTNLLAVDWVGAEKMGLDPMVSRYMQLAAQAFGIPKVELSGDGSLYAPWCNVPKEIVDFWDAAEESYGFTNTVFSIMNRNYMSPAFRRRPMTWITAKLSRLLSPLGGFVYKRHDEGGNPPGEDAE